MVSSNILLGWQKYRVTSENVYQLMRAARARWKIENETFNTLKNQGYHFEHNYGHGKENLSSLTLLFLDYLCFVKKDYSNLTVVSGQI